MGDNFDYKDYYEILGVDRTATVDQIKERYRKLAITLHPDRNPEKSAMARFKRVSEAYQVLRDDSKRRMIDDWLNKTYRTRSGPGFQNESWINRFAGVRAPRAGGKRAPLFRFAEIAFSPRVLIVSSGLLLMGYCFLGPREEITSPVVTAWYNDKSGRWETPAPWNEDYRRNIHTQRKIHRYLVFESQPPQSPH